MHQFITYKGKEILYADYSGCKSMDEMMTVLESSSQVLINHPDKLLILINYEGAYASMDYMKRAKRMSAETHHKVAKRAIIGMTEIQAILLKTFNRFAKDKAYAFKTKEQALEFLIS